MKLTIITAAGVPVAALLLLVIATITMACIVAVHKHKVAEQKFQDKVTKHSIAVIDILSQKMPQERYPEFLTFAEKIYLSSCKVCDSTDGGKGQDQIDGEEGVDSLHASQGKETVASKLLGAADSILKSFLDNPKISEPLARNIVTELARRKVPGVAATTSAGSISAVNPLVVTTAGEVTGESVPLLLSGTDNSQQDLECSSSSSSGSAHLQS